jgi:hypothetical protein
MTPLPGYSVAADELVDLGGAVDVIAALCGELGTKVVPNAALAPSHWPKAAEEARLAYDEARTAMASASTALSEAAGAIFDGLGDVLRRYGLAEAVAEMQVDRQKRENDQYRLLDYADVGPRGGGASNMAKLATLGVGLSGSGIALGAGLGLYKGARTSALYTSELLGMAKRGRLAVGRGAAAAGVSALIAVADQLLVWPNLRSAEPFFDEWGTWEQVQYAVTQVTDEAEGLRKHFPLKNWEGDAATRFTGYIDRTFLQAADELSALAASMATLCEAVEKQVNSYIGSQVLVMFLTAPVLALCPFMAFGAGLAYAQVAASVYIASSAFTYLVFKDAAKGPAAQAKEVTKRATELLALCRSEKSRLDAGSNVLKSEFTAIEAGDWTAGFHPKD